MLTIKAFRYLAPEEGGAPVKRGGVSESLDSQKINVLVKNLRIEIYTADALRKPSIRLRMVSLTVMILSALKALLPAKAYPFEKLPL